MSVPWFHVPSVPGEGAQVALDRDEAKHALGVRRLGSGDVVVVFDGQSGPGLSTGGGVPVEIVYAHSGSADDEIVRIVTKASGNVVIVSGDRELLERAQAQAGARLERRDASCCFEAAGKGAERKTKARGSVARDTGLPRGASAITRELKDLWLTDDE